MQVIETVRKRQAGTVIAHTSETLQVEIYSQFTSAITDDLNTPKALTILERISDFKGLGLDAKLEAVAKLDGVTGLNLLTLTRADLRIRPASATLTEADIEARLNERKAARAAKDFATSDRIRDDLAAQGVEVMDGDSLGWDWKPVL